MKQGFFNKRVVLGLLFFVSLFFLPWYITMISLLAFLILTPYREVLLYGFILDLTWHPFSVWYMNFFFLTITFVLYLVLNKLKLFIRS